MYIMHNETLKHEDNFRVLVITTYNYRYCTVDYTSYVSFPPLLPLYIHNAVAIERKPSRAKPSPSLNKKSNHFTHQIQGKYKKVLQF